MAEIGANLKDKKDAGVMVPHISMEFTIMAPKPVRPWRMTNYSIINQVVIQL